MKYLLLLLITAFSLSGMEYPKTTQTIPAERNKPFLVELFQTHQTNWTCIAQDSRDVILVSEEYRDVLESSISSTVIGQQALLTFVATRPTTLKFMLRQLDETGRRATRVLEEKAFHVTLPKILE